MYRTLYETQTHMNEEDDDSVLEDNHKCFRLITKAINEWIQNPTKKYW